MTREEAIKLLTQYIDYDAETPDYYEMEEACKVALKVLKQEPCEDVIDRAEAMTEIMMFAGNVKSDEEDIYIKVSDAVQLLRELPPITPKPKMGHWEQFGYSWKDKFKCSECGKEQPKILCGERIIGHWSDYCPNCGADMRESEDDT